MKMKAAETRNAETVTMPRAEYEQLQGQVSAQEKYISVLEKQVELLTEALRLSRGLVHPLNELQRMLWNS